MLHLLLIRLYLIVILRPGILITLIIDIEGDPPIFTLHHQRQRKRQASAMDLHCQLVPLVRPNPHVSSEFLA